MTKEEIVYTIKAMLHSVDKTSKYHPNLIAMRCNFVWAQILNDAFKKEPGTLDFFAKEYNGIAVSTDATTTKYYADLPAPIMVFQSNQRGLPSIKEGIRHISTDTGDDLEFVPISETELRLSEGLEVDQVKSTVGTSTIYYIPRFDKVIFVKNMSSGQAAAGVTMRLVIPFNEYDDTDHLPIPSGMGETFINTVVQAMMGIPPVDLDNKNNG